MPLFSKTELLVIEAVAHGETLKKLSTNSKLSENRLEEALEAVKEKLGAAKASEVLERFKNLTGWSGAPTDYPN